MAGSERTPRSSQGVRAGDSMQVLSVERVDEIPIILRRLTRRIRMLLAEVFPCDVIIQ